MQTGMGNTGSCKTNISQLHSNHNLKRFCNWVYSFTFRMCSYPGFVRHNSGRVKVTLKGGFKKEKKTLAVQYKRTNIPTPPVA